jgi:hypothetical protein
MDFPLWWSAMVRVQMSNTADVTDSRTYDPMEQSTRFLGAARPYLACQLLKGLFEIPPFHSP